MSDEATKGDIQDDSYVLEDTGETIEDIEHEMEVAAQQAVSGAESATPNTDEGLRTENEQLKNRYMRTLADFENFRKRSEREKTEFYKYALANTMRDLLPVLDNFDRALEHAAEGDDFHQGVSLIYKQLWDALQRNGLKAIDETNVHFDPNIHEAVIRDEDPSVPSHTVVGVLQKGYFLGDRLLRPAMVRVAVGGSEEPTVEH